MNRKPKKDNGGLVYSTNRDFLQEQNTPEETPSSLSPSQQQLRVQLDSKQRAGKVVTLVTGFVGNENDLVELAKFLKTHCGVGGSAKDNEIVVQGNHKDKVIELLKKKGYRVK